MVFMKSAKKIYFPLILFAFLAALSIWFLRPIIFTPHQGIQTKAPTNIFQTNPNERNPQPSAGLFVKFLEESAARANTNRTELPSYKKRMPSREQFEKWKNSDLPLLLEIVNRNWKFSKNSPIDRKDLGDFYGQKQITVDGLAIDQLIYSYGLGVERWKDEDLGTVFRGYAKDGVTVNIVEAKNEVKKIELSYLRDPEFGDEILERREKNRLFRWKQEDGRETFLFGDLEQDLFVAVSELGTKYLRNLGGGLYQVIDETGKPGETYRFDNEIKNFVLVPTSPGKSP